MIKMNQSVFVFRKRKNLRILFSSVTLLLLFIGRVFSATITITPTGNDDAQHIQTTMNDLQNGDTLRLTGDFVIGKTIYLPSNFTWILEGTLTLAANADLNEAGWVDAQIDATRRTAITEKNGGWK